MKVFRSTVVAACGALRDELDLASSLMTSVAAGEKGSTALLQFRRQTYTHGIISIYGLLEEYIDNLLIQVAAAYSAIFPTYAELPTNTKATHREYVLRCLLDGDKARVRDRASFDESLATRSLGQPASSPLVGLIGSVFTYKTANYRHEYICGQLRRLDIEIARPELFKSASGVIADRSLEFRDIDALIKNLVERRNVVAHSHGTDDLLELDTLIGYLAAIECYLYDWIEAGTARILGYLCDHKLQSLGTVAHRWSAAIGVDMTRGTVDSPATVLLRKQGGHVTALPVTSLRMNNIPTIGPIRAQGQTVEVGLGIEVNIPSNAVGSDVYAVPGEWAHLLPH